MSFVPPVVAPISWQGFLNFLQYQVGVPSAALPPVGDSLVIDSSGNQVLDSSGNPVTSNPNTYPPQVWALVIALALVNRVLRVAGYSIYARAVYCLASDRLINFGMDQPNQNWFAEQRKLYKIGAFAPGVVQSAGDQGTNSSLVVPEQFKNFTVMDLQTLHTPWGREYVGLAQAFGQSLYGLT
jgi:subtilisin family serine protease